MGGGCRPSTMLHPPLTLTPHDCKRRLKVSPEREISQFIWTQEAWIDDIQYLLALYVCDSVAHNGF